MTPAVASKAAVIGSGKPVNTWQAAWIEDQRKLAAGRDAVLRAQNMLMRHYLGQTTSPGPKKRNCPHGHIQSLIIPILRRYGSLTAKQLTYKVDFNGNTSISTPLNLLLKQGKVVRTGEARSHDALWSLPT